MPEAGQRFAFCFSTASGHTNPSFPIARQLVKRGHSVTYLSSAVFKGAIEATGAAFVDEVEELSELMQPDPAKPRAENFMSAFLALATEFGKDAAHGYGNIKQWAATHNIAIERQLPAFLRFFSEENGALKFDAAVYDNLMLGVVAHACRLLNLPAVALCTVAGPGSMEVLTREMASNKGMTLEDMDRLSFDDEDGAKAVARLRERYPSLELPSHPFSCGTWQYIGGPRAMTLVTTIEPLRDPISDNVSEALRAADVRFTYIGPSLDVKGAKRAGGFIFDAHNEEPEDDEPKLHRHRSDLTDSSDAPLAALQEAKQLNASVVAIYISLGTVITSDMRARPVSPHVQQLGDTLSTVLRLL